MNNSQIILTLALKEVGVKVSVESFDERLICQKTTCILQEAGIPLGYFFNWYIKGPYSSSLANDVFSIAELGDKTDELFGQWKLGEQTLERLAPLKGLFSILPEDVKEKARMLELWASLLFLKRTNQINVDNLPSIQKILKANEKHYEDLDVLTAINNLRKNGLPI